MFGGNHLAKSARHSGVQLKHNHVDHVAVLLIPATSFFVERPGETWEDLDLLTSLPPSLGCNMPGKPHPSRPLTEPHDMQNAMLCGSICNPKWKLSPHLLAGWPRDARSRGTDCVNLQTLLYSGKHEAIKTVAPRGLAKQRCSWSWKGVS